MTPKIKICLVEDDTNLSYVIEDTLVEAGYVVELFRDGETAQFHLAKHEYDLCLLDVMLPKKDGFEVAQFLRTDKPDLPIIFLTAKSLLEDKGKGFGLGADDYITKPFHVEELLMRIEAVLNRRGIQPKEKKPDAYPIGRLQFKPAEQRLYLENQEIKLSKKESQLLELLVENKNQVVQRNYALNKVWGSDDYFLGRSMDVYITKLRKALKADEKIQIQNVHGVGFKLVVGE